MGFSHTRWFGIAWSAVAAACLSAQAGNSTSASSSSSGPSGSSSEVAFSAVEGRHTVNGDVLEIKAHELLVNGIFYGKVNSSSNVKYRVRGNEKAVYVDGKKRQPEK
ncbi:hypothetical protein [Noviherbaspirillum denitrificans]|uniref:Uncharacterized protein n=1 Tax=Noviherbaspirillum denitrificans TaxID=1968433 RepID=A0A254T6K5_9BURK|nr:hypothetical protein [Noviherbaspirillum denitrificans]OWW18294.1 hypothetical protein AYR66_02220 [Noviherbaspirillum denitrificans]